MTELQSSKRTFTISGDDLKRWIESEFLEAAYTALDEEQENIEDIDTVKLDPSTIDLNHNTWDFTVSGEVTYSLADESSASLLSWTKCPTCGRDYDQIDVDVDEDD